MSSGRARSTEGVLSRTSSAEHSLSERRSEQVKQNNRTLGSQKEQTAAAYLEKKGYRILAANYRCPAGEIDLIAMDQETVVFVEVKYRCGNAAGEPEESVTARKQRTISRCALFFISRYKWAIDAPFRFDVVAVTPRGIRHIIDAFPFSG